MLPRWRRRRPDFSERAAERMAAGVGPYEPLPPSRSRYTPRRLLFYFFLGVITLAVLRGGLGRGAPPVNGSCTHPAFAVDHNEVMVNGVLKWSVAGPSGSRVVFAADRTTVPASGQLVGPLPLKNCKASGRFGVILKAGDHVLHVFLIAPDGSVKQIGTKPITVNPAR